MLKVEIKIGNPAAKKKDEFFVRKFFNRFRGKYLSKPILDVLRRKIIFGGIFCFLGLIFFLPPAADCQIIGQKKLFGNYQEFVWQDQHGLPQKRHQSNRSNARRLFVAGDCRRCRALRRGAFYGFRYGKYGGD